MTPLFLIVGLLLGFWARDMYNMLKQVRDYFKDRIETPPGVVQPNRTLVTKSRPIDDSETGSVMRPTPNQIAIQSIIDNEKELSRKLKNV